MKSYEILKPEISRNPRRSLAPLRSAREPQLEAARSPWLRHLEAPTGSRGHRWLQKHRLAPSTTKEVLGATKEVLGSIDCLAFN